MTPINPEHLTDREYLKSVYVRLFDHVSLLAGVETSSSMSVATDVSTDAERARGYSDDGHVITTNVEHDRVLHELIIAHVLANAVEALLTPDELAECKHRMRDEELKKLELPDDLDEGIAEIEAELRRVRKEMFGDAFSTHFN